MGIDDGGGFPPPTGSSVELTVQVAVGGDEADGLPDEGACRRWVEAALVRHGGGGQLTLRIVGRDEMARLNGTYRHRAGVTNVLSFPCDCGERLIPPLLGDIVVCAPRVVEEAGAQGKAVLDHWAHLVVHGCLHLLGYEHDETDEAERMEALEVEILAGLGIPDPYRPAAPEAARPTGVP